MDSTAYNYIRDQLKNSKYGVLGQVERDRVYKQFLDSYISALDAVKKETGNDPTQAEKERIEASFLTESTIDSYVAASKSYYEKLEKTIENNYQEKLAPPNYFKSIGLGILANFLYSILLLIVFWLGQDQIASWLSSLMAK